MVSVDETAVAPALSTYQDEATFEFARVGEVEKTRVHLGLYENENLEARISEYYSLDELADFLAQKTEDSPTYKRITLQFPDLLICDSATIVHQLQTKLGLVPEEVTEVPQSSCCGGSCKQESAHQKIWILADTSYSSCCIDEVAAEHVNSDLVVHFGDACLNIVDKLPSVYIFGNPRLNVDTITQHIRDRFPDKETKVLLMADAPHTSLLKAVHDHLGYPNTAYADLHVDPLSKSLIIGYLPTEGTFTDLNRTFVGVESADDFQDYDLFHITIPETPRLLQLTTRFLSVTTLDPYSGEVSQGPYPNLMRRYRYMHMARSAGTVGLLVNTLSLTNTKKLVNLIAKKLKDAGKKHYIFVVGKPNVAKLANFENVDIWCILGCDHQGIIVDEHNEYFKPIVTPYELLLALSDEVTWTGKWVTDFQRVLENLSEEKEQQEEEDDDSESEAPEFNPVTGQYVSTSRPLRQLNHLQVTASEEAEDENALVKRFSTAVAIKNTVSTSAAHLQTRHWTGLGSDWKNDSDDSDAEQGALAEEGRGGVARGYDYDREVHSLLD